MKGIYGLNVIEKCCKPGSDSQYLHEHQGSTYENKYSYIYASETSYLDSDSDALVLYHLDERDAIIRVLVECFVEEDHSTDAVINAVISGEEHLAVETAVLLIVLYPYLVQTLPHAAC